MKDLVSLQQTELLNDNVMDFFILTHLKNKFLDPFPQIAQKLVLLDSNFSVSMSRCSQKGELKEFCLKTPKLQVSDMKLMQLYQKLGVQHLLSTANTNLIPEFKEIQEFEENPIIKDPISLFSKTFTLFPVNWSSHWVLFLFCHLDNFLYCDQPEIFAQKQQDHPALILCLDPMRYSPSFYTQIGIHPFFICTLFNSYTYLKTSSHFETILTI